MADNFVANPGTGGDTFAADDVAGVKYPYSKIDIGGDGVSSPVTAANPMPVELTDGTNPVVIKPLSTVPVAADNALMTQAIIHGRTTAGGGSFVDVKVNPSGALSADISDSTNVGVTGPLTNAELRAANVPTSNNATVFLFSTNNSSDVQLAAGATFTGVIETTLDQPSISLLLTSDQNMIVTVRQFIDLAGTRAAPNIVFNVAAGVGLARSMPLNGNYVQVLAQNIGAATTTTFNINTAYGDILPADSSGALPTTELPLILAGQAAQTAVVNNILTTTAGTAPIDVSGYRAASVQVVSTGTAGTFIFEQSNDGTNWVALPVFNGALVTGVPITAAITATASAIVYSFAIRCSFVRLRIATTITGGSIRAFSRFSTDSWTPSVNLVASNTAANLQATVSGTVTANQATPTAGILNSAATTNGTVVKASAGTLYGVTLTNNGAGSAYFKLHNSTTVTVGTTAVASWILIPAGQSVAVNWGPIGMRYGTGICYSITGAVADTDTTAVAAGQVKVNLSYI
jgi:hypothetical protein